MRRAAIAVALAVGIATLVVLSWPHSAPYPALRQASVQEIPGTLGYAVQPPPEDLVPALTPREVEERYPANGGDVQVSLASVLDVYRDHVLGSGWVLVARGVCLRNQKGELVSDARGGGDALRCTDETIWLLGVDASTGEPFVGLAGHDAARTWTLDVGV